MAVFVLGCEKETEYKYFKVKNESSLNQTVYADDTKVPFPIEFTTTGAWTSSIEYSTISEDAEAKLQRANGVSSGWITLNPNSGDSAGDYSVNIYLNPEKCNDIYKATISFICNGETLVVTIENSMSNNPGSAEDMSDPEKVDAAKQELTSGFLSVRDIFNEIDNDYSTPDSRNSFTSKSTLLENMWFKSYGAINTCNLLLGACENEVISGQEREQIMSQAIMYRGILHFYLATLFGDVPVQTAYPSELYPVRTEINEVMDFVKSEMDMAINYIPVSSSYRQEACFVRILATAFAEETFMNDEVKNLLKDFVESNVFEFDSNGDGVVNDQDSQTAVQSYLLLAYVESEDNLMYSIERLNFLAEKLKNNTFRIENSATSESVKQKVVELLTSGWDNGIKYIVNRLINQYTWEDKIVLPIPERELISNLNMTQNPGWN